MMKLIKWFRWLFFYQISAKPLAIFFLSVEKKDKAILTDNPQQTTESPPPKKNNMEGEVLEYLKANLR